VAKGCEPSTDLSESSNPSGLLQLLTLLQLFLNHPGCGSTGLSLNYYPSYWITIELFLDQLGYLWITRNIHMPLGFLFDHSIFLQGIMH